MDIGTQVEGKFALRAVSIASQLCREIRHELITPALSKSDHSPVTVADFASQAVIARMLKETFPEAILVAEEDSLTLQEPGEEQTLHAVTSFVQQVFPDEDEASVCKHIDVGQGQPNERYWTLDPIDGTKGFIRGGQYVVALALIENDAVVFGALGCPNLNIDVLPSSGTRGAILLAGKGQGTWVMDEEGGHARRLYVSEIDRGEDARILRSFAPEHTDLSKLKRIVEASGTSHEPILMDSQAKYAQLAGGHGDLLFRLVSTHQPDREEYIWDHAAGSIIVAEAGGRVTDLDGEELDYATGRTLKRNRGVLASNGRLHEQALQLVQSA